MKTLIAIVFAVVLVLAMVVPAVAAPPPTVTTSVHLDGDNSSFGPIIKVKWEQSSSNSNGTTIPTTYGNVNPPLVKCGTVLVDYYAIVTGPSPDYGNLANVFAYVYSPADSPAPYNVPDDPVNPSVHPNYKYKVDFSPVTNIAAAVAAFNAVPSTALTYGVNNQGTRYTAADILLELNKPEATLWHGAANLTYEQPAGNYIVDVYGVTKAGKMSLIPTSPINTTPFQALENTFSYNAVPYIAIDFTSFNYGAVKTGVDTWVYGDTTMNPTLPNAAGIDGQGQPQPSPKSATVENIGNTWASIDFWQDDMGLNAGTPGINEVYYDYRMGNGVPLTGQPANLVNGVKVGPGSILDNSLGLSMREELDFSILIVQPIAGQTIYSGHLVISPNLRLFTSANPVSGQPDPCP